MGGRVLISNGELSNSVKLRAELNFTSVFKPAPRNCNSELIKKKGFTELHRGLPFIRFQIP